MKPLSRRSFLGSIPGAMLIAAAQQSPGDAIPNRPKVPGTLSLRARRRTKDAGATEQVLQWPVARTAIVICDMWDTHTCGMSAQRVALMAPRMNQVVSAARSLGVMIIHAPSDTMKFYEGTPWRERMRSAPTAASPFPIIARCPRVPEEERDFPIDDSAGGCDDPIVKPDDRPALPLVPRASGHRHRGLRRCQRERPGDLQLLQAGRHRQDRPDGSPYQYLHLESRVRGAADDPARLRGGAGAGSHRLHV